ncbi:NDR1/HIN1-like protein 6 [Zingiber officinale]|uniref:NDR1/HIN1-like protein 6 n=1 Tax=Zingiber officinale TaxID=94328 RepID=UPI001C4D81C7|nr:NDR1/HIN1-like protein 6 [Zingiber officinale]
MTHTLDIPLPAAAAATAGDKASALPVSIPPLRPPPYRRALPSYLSGRHSSSKCGRGRCLCSALLAVLLFVVVFLLLLGICFDPRAPAFFVEHLELRRVAANSADLGLALLLVNPSSRVLLRYSHGGSVAVSFRGGRLGSGDLPAFLQRPRNATKIAVAVRGRGARAAAAAVVSGKKGKGDVALRIHVRAPVQFGLGRLDLVKATVVVDYTVVVHGFIPGKEVDIKSTEHTRKIEF